MAVSAYAALLSLSHVLENVQLPARRSRLHLDTQQLQSLQEKVEFLWDFLELHSQKRSQEMEDLGRQISIVADEAEDVIDLHVVYQLGEGSRDHKSDPMAALSSFCQDIDRVVEKIDSITEGLMKMEEEWGNVLEQKPVPSLLPSSSTPLVSGKNTMVGFDEYLVQIMDELTRDDSDLLILPIVGMGGIGKTTLARNVFGHLSIAEYFDIRNWFTASQEYSVKEILLGLLNIKIDHERGETVGELGQRLYQNLFGRRYLIVLDDVWSTKVWDDLKALFPNNRNGSRVLLTTRLFDVARSLGSHDHYLKINFLDEDKSWNLLCEKVFAQEGCPYPELEEIGKSIAKGCNGLPLAIVVIGGLLAKSNMTQEYWEFVVKNLTSFSNSEDDEHCSRVLSLSYNHLPIHLKPCFLYWRVFPEDHQTISSDLIKSWLAEGFLKPIKGKTLEEAAEEYLKELIDRNLIIVIDQGLGIRPGLAMHDLLRDLCLREYQKEHFILIPRVQHVTVIDNRIEECFICCNGFTLGSIDLPEVNVASQSTSLASLLVCETCKNMYSGLTRLRVVRVKYCHSTNFEILHPTRLRWLKISNVFEMEFTTSSTVLSLLWNLQCLKTEILKVLPYEIWDMPQLKHITCLRLTLPDPVAAQDCTILENFQTLTNVRGFRCTDEVIKKIPNIKKLNISYYKVDVEWSYYCLYNLARLRKLEWLELIAQDLLVDHIAFPSSLRQLILSNCRIPWEHMTIIGSLPNLKELYVFQYAFEGPEWNPVEGEFPRLEELMIVNSNLVWWRAENIHFPNLKLLQLYSMHNLQEIPLSIGDIDTLEKIVLRGGNKSAKDSAKQIAEEQHNNGNESLQVYVDWDKVIVS
ncbi:putative disease resistance RPP8-like protein 2 [Sesamum angolense]|uniref:Disease resistance RPP8-like protein 2 n=1 Tax=Sesamum angolense TaxID=2727404 RepID=A0AAE2BRC8_9LAMI|nr:putative disease resistance RPP8-like protein 2 [Sesamum angolense]